ncbi:MAG: SAM-dependent methyltransferase [Flavobacteriaceae bacterium]|nr:SAM-dependent methyltransferase [Flavobacteriaceae bacterium]|tara:strand:+ start:536 stop:1279 length:744 start_codon:yes stop_codon:yes gene_type:complete
MTEDNPAWYQTWFNTPYYHILYRDRDIDEATLFLQNLLTYLKLKQHQSILDVACGKGRHSLYLASQGFQVTGIDLSPNSISFAQKEAESKSLEVEFYVHDMRTPAHEQAAVVLNLFTSIGYFEDKNDNLKAIQAFYDSTAVGGYVVIDFLNVPSVKQGLVADEVVTKCGIQFTLKRTFEAGWIQKDISFNDNGVSYTFQERVAALERADFKLMLDAAGFSVQDVFGDYTLTPFVAETAERLILVARK